MRMALIAAFISVLGAVAGAPAAGVGPNEGATQVVQSEARWHRPVTEPGQPRRKAGRRSALAKPLCTMRVLRADPRVDLEIAQGQGRDVDAGMVVPSRCRD